MKGERTHRRIHGQEGDLISLLLFIYFQNNESRLRNMVEKRTKWMWELAEAS
jgi:hypothetical protein